MLHSSETWDNTPEITLFNHCKVGRSSPVYPKTYVPFRDLLDSAKNVAAVQHATSLCTAWMTFSAGAQVDSILIFNSNLSLAVQFFSDCSRAPRLRTVVTTKPLHFTVHDTGTITEYQSAAIPPLWSGDPRFQEPNQLVTYATWSFWRERAPAVFTQPHTPIYCTACSSSTGKAFRFHFLSNGELIVIGSTSGFICRGSSIIAGRDVALSAFQTFITNSDVSAVAPLFVENSPPPTLSIHSFCQMAAAFENVPTKSAWKVGENLYDRLIISSWAPNLNKLVTRAALDFSSSEDTSRIFGPLKRRKISNFARESGTIPEQTWEEYQDFESQQERGDRLYAQRLQDQELAVHRLNALRSRREKQLLLSIDQEAQIPIMTQNECANVAGPDISVSHQSASLSSPLGSKAQSDALSDSGSPQPSLRLAASCVDCLSSAASGHKIRFVFKHDVTNPPPKNFDSSSIFETTSLRVQNFCEVFVDLYFSALLKWSLAQAHASKCCGSIFPCNSLKADFLVDAYTLTHFFSRRSSSCLLAMYVQKSTPGTSTTNGEYLHI
jgi:hypothetical protein